MKKASILFMIIGLLMVNIVFAAERGTSAEAEALVKKAVAYIKANGREKAFSEFGDPKGAFVDRDLYLFVYDIKGVCVTHGQNPRMVGKDLSDLTDPSGKAFVKERIEIAKSRGKGWQNYRFSNPITKKIEDLIVGSGVYK